MRVSPDISGFPLTIICLCPNIINVNITNKSEYKPNHLNDETRTSKLLKQSQMGVGNKLHENFTNWVYIVLLSGFETSILYHRKNRIKEGNDNIEDVYDGNIYRETFDLDGFFHGTTEEKKEKEIHISLQINTDGVAVFKSSKFSVWPIYAVVNELPPQLR